MCCCTLYRFQLDLLGAGEEEQLDVVVDQMARLGDKKGLEALALMGARVKNFLVDKVVAVLKVMARHSGCWNSKMVVEVKGLEAYSHVRALSLF